MSNPLFFPNLRPSLQLQASLEAATAAAAEASAALDAGREAAAAAAAAAEESRAAAVAAAEEAHAAAAAAAKEARSVLAAELEAAQAQLESEGQRLQAELDEAQNVALQLVAEKEQLEVRGVFLRDLIGHRQGVVLPAMNSWLRGRSLLPSCPLPQGDIRDAETRAACMEREKEALQRSMGAEIEELQAALQVGLQGCGWVCIFAAMAHVRDMN